MEAHKAEFMEKGVCVKDIVPNIHVAGLFVVGSADLGQSRNGPFWKLILFDATGNVEAKIWHPLSAEFAEIISGSVAFVSGRSSLYKDQVQLSLDKFSPLSEDLLEEVDRRDFVPASPYDPEEMLNELKTLCLEEFKYPPWRKLILSVLNNSEYRKALLTMPAAKSLHHAYAGGLLEHTLGVCRLCRAIADQYPQLDRQTLLAGAFFHDFGKIRELSTGFVNDYTDQGKLLGHIFLGMQMLDPLMADAKLDAHLAEHLRHLVISHHGELEFGAPKLPQTPEALALHYADNLDAKLAQFRNVFAAADTEYGDWGPWQRTLDRAFFRAKPTPGQNRGHTQQTAIKRDEQCLSLLKE